MSPRPEEARAELLRLLAAPPDPFPLDRAALLLAAIDHPGLDTRPYEERLDGYAARVAAAAGPDSQPRQRLAALRRVLFEEESFHGNRADYYDVRNSYLHEVLDRKLGIPISLAAVLLGIARRLEWPLYGVNFPVHFLLAYPDPQETLAIDPFHGGLILGEEELAERWQFATGGPAPPLQEMLLPAPPRETLVRMLNNIRYVSASRQDHGRAADATELVAHLQPQSPQHLRDAGLLHLLAGRGTRGVELLRRYLEQAPHAPDAGAVRDQLERLGE